jgi:hypothetical protein
MEYAHRLRGYFDEINQEGCTDKGLVEESKQKNK